MPTRRDWARLSGEWTKRIDQRIAELQRLRRGLTECIGCGCLSIDRCRLANPADRAAGRGQGRATGWGRGVTQNLLPLWAKVPAKRADEGAQRSVLDEGHQVRR